MSFFSLLFCCVSLSAVKGKKQGTDWLCGPGDDANATFFIMTLRVVLLGESMARALGARVRERERALLPDESHQKQMLSEIKRKSKVVSVKVKGSLDPFVYLLEKFPRERRLLNMMIMIA